MTEIVEVVTSVEVIELVVEDQTLLLVGPPGTSGPAAVPGFYSDNGPPSDLNVAPESLYLDLSTYDLYKLGD